MNAKKIFVVLVVLFCFPAIVYAQQQLPRTISGGVLNGKAVSLPKPAYPQIARAAQAGGTVVVQITIGEDGNVLSATAISGHPLLKAAAVQAAYGARFSPTLLDGKPVKVTGTINYNFMMPLSWLDIGTQLAENEKDFRYRSFPYFSNALFSQEFESERNELQELQQIPIKSDNEETSDTTKQNSSPTPGKVMVMVVGANAPDPISREEYSKRLSSVINSIQTKLMNDSVKSWYFSLGLIIGRTKQSLDNDTGILATIEHFRNHSLISPTGASEAIVSNLQKLSYFSNKTSFTDEDKAEINQLIQAIKRVPIEKY